jgi:hypothetical protein
MGSLLPFSHVWDHLEIYFRDVQYDYNNGSYCIDLKKEYPYTLFLHQKNQSVLPKIRETMEEKCRSIAIYQKLKLDYRVPGSKNQRGEYRLNDFSSHRHGYYVIYCRLQNDQVILKLAVPEFDEPSTYDPEYESWHRARIEEYQNQCIARRQTNCLATERQHLENALKKLI